MSDPYKYIDPDYTYIDPHTGVLRNLQGVNDPQVVGDGERLYIKS